MLEARVGPPARGKDFYGHKKFAPLVFSFIGHRFG